MPETKTDVIKAVAEAVDADGNLRWPTLSREKCQRKGHEASVKAGGGKCYFCNSVEIEREPDVTEVKLLDSIAADGWSMDLRDVIPVEKRVWIHSDERVGEGGIFRAETFLEALCKARLET